MSDQKISDNTPSTFSGVGRDAVDAMETLAQRVQWARADVSVHDADGAEREHGETRGMLRMRAAGQRLRLGNWGSRGRRWLKNYRTAGARPR